MARVRVLTVVVLVSSPFACGRGRANDSAGPDTNAIETSADGPADESDTGSETGTPADECLLAIRIDLCCNQAFPATPEALDGCVVAWPIDWDALPQQLVADCVAAQPQWCEIVDCDFADPASDVVAADDMGGCAYVCPDDTYLAYRNPGCGEPPPVVECLGIPPPCADEYCSCAGETIYGCGQVDQPFADFGPCQ